jgi:NAD(P)-dependent dehydrogenase (short-subunit alcohol dehydrogenase family)
MNIIVTGANSGLGRALVEELMREPEHYVVAVDLRFSRDAPGHHLIDCDVRKESAVRDLHNAIQDPVDGIVNCAGINHLAWLADLRNDDWTRVMDTNARSIYLIAQRFQSELEQNKGVICNVVSNASHVPMRCSLAYNMSKAAAHMATLQLARELAPRVTVFGISPNKMEGTAMSRYIESKVPELRGWTPEQAQSYQQQSLLAMAETPPKRVAEFIAFLLSHRERHRYLTGCILPYGA